MSIQEGEDLANTIRISVKDLDPEKADMHRSFVHAQTYMVGFVV